MKPDNAARVDAYLDQVLAPLTRRLSRSQQEELRRELNAHLWERINASQELGQSEDDAVTEALRQFGGAEDFLKQWRREWLKTTPLATLREIGAATCTALLLSLPALLMTCPGSLVWPHTLFVNQLDWMPDWLRLTPVAYVTSGWTSFGLNLIILPLAVGAAAGRLAPQRAAVGMLAALTAEMVLTDWYLLPAVLNLGWFGERLSEQIFFCSVLWLPLACASAALTGWWTQRKQARQAM